jgi:hypothetical protein
MSDVMCIYYTTRKGWEIDSKSRSIKFDDNGERYVHVDYPCITELEGERFVRLPSSVCDDIPFEEGYLDGNTIPDESMLGRVFAVMNHEEWNPLSAYHPSGGMQNWMRGTEVSHTSMSVGDVVGMLNERGEWDYYYCDMVGWHKLEDLTIKRNTTKEDE